MGARQKLNGAYAKGSLIQAAIIGGICQCWIAFILAAGLLLAINLAEGDIRPNKRGH
jgi:hypothetical protein